MASGLKDVEALDRGRESKCLGCMVVAGKVWVSWIGLGHATSFRV